MLVSCIEFTSLLIIVVPENCLPGTRYLVSVKAKGCFVFFLYLVLRTLSGLGRGFHIRYHGYVSVCYFRASAQGHLTLYPWYPWHVC